MSAFNHRCSHGVLLLLLAAAPLTAQGTAFQECDAATVGALPAAQLGAWADYTPNRLRARFEPARRAGAWSAIADTLGMLFGVKAAPAGLPVPPASLAALSAADRALLATQLDAVGIELRMGEQNPAAQINGAITPARFAVSAAVFPGLPQRVTIFNGRPGGPIAIDPLPPVERRTICWLAIAVQDLTTLYGGPARASLAAALARRAERWDNFSRRGYSMTPLELFVNGYMPRAELEPPRTQLVLGHVSPGEQMYAEGGTRLENFKRRTVLVLEPVGAVRYSAQYDSYWGATLVLAYPDSGGLAPGIMLHHSSVGHVAGLWRPKGPTTSGGAAVLLSLDLYRYLSGARDQLDKLKNEVTLGGCLADVPSCMKPLAGKL
jgi:hypothetical protein